MPMLSGTLDVRDAADLERFGGPFDLHAHRVDVRRAASGRGRYNVPNLGLHLWRVGSAELTRSQAKPIPGNPNFHRFDAWGHDGPLYNRPRTETDIASLAAEVNLPLPLRRRELAADLSRAMPLYLGADPVVAVRLAPDAAPLTPLIGNLSGVPGALPAARPQPGQVIIDPELGRLALHDDDLPVGGAAVLVDHAFGYVGEIGCGPWDRSVQLDAQLGDIAVDWRHHVTTHPTLMTELGAVATLEAAIVAWNAFVATAEPGVVGTIVLLGGRSGGTDPAIPAESHAWAPPASTIALPSGARLYILAGGVELTDAGPRPRPHGTQAIIEGKLRVVGGHDDTVTRPGGLWLNGIGLVGGVEVQAGELDVLSLSSCTIHPTTGTITIAGAVGHTNAGLELELERCVCGPITATTEIASATLASSIVQGPSTAISLPGAALELGGSTMLGQVRCRSANASDTIFTGTLHVEQHQQGCLRFCYVPSGGQTPRPFRCQPRLALEGITHADLQTATRRRLQPIHVSERFGEPGYGLLAPHAPLELHTGAENGAAMGVFNHLQHARREARLLQTFDRYLRFGLEAGLFLES
jgi:hypothetical protein